MFTHAEIWQAIDRHAAVHRLTPSGLAKRARLDPTTFNKSKRVTRDGKPRWPSTETIAKILEATGTSLTEFAGFIDGKAVADGASRAPLIAFAKAGEDAYLDSSGCPVPGRWEEFTFPGIAESGCNALKIGGDAMEPFYRDGDVLVVSPDAAIRCGDRAVVKTTAGEIVAGRLTRQSATGLELATLAEGSPERVLASSDVAWAARIVWASQ